VRVLITGSAAATTTTTHQKFVLKVHRKLKYGYQVGCFTIPFGQDNKRIEERCFFTTNTACLGREMNGCGNQFDLQQRHLASNSIQQFCRRMV
jgi:hypothetical protein